MGEIWYYWVYIFSFFSNRDVKRNGYIFRKAIQLKVVCLPSQKEPSIIGKNLFSLCAGGKHNVTKVVSLNQIANISYQVYPVPFTKYKQVSRILTWYHVYKHSITYINSVSRWAGELISSDINSSMRREQYTRSVIIFLLYTLYLIFVHSFTRITPKRANYWRCASNIDVISEQWCSFGSIT